jgi:hypothetical protein
VGHAGRQVIAWTPFGRERTVSILYRYLQRDHERGLIDQWWLYLNTDHHGQESDVAYAQQLARRHDWIVVKNRPRRATKYAYRHKQEYTQYFYEYATDPGTVYLRFDDDEVFVAPPAVERLVEQKTQRPHTLCLFSTNVNNAIISWYMQQIGVIPVGSISGTAGVTWPRVQAPYCMDPVGWADPLFAELLHCWVLDLLEAGDHPKLELYQDITLSPGQQFSVSVFAMEGKDLAALDPPGHINHEEETWLTTTRPMETGMVNQICSTSVTVHYSFFPQRPHLDTLNILDRYRALADKECS